MLRVVVRYDDSFLLNILVKIWRTFPLRWKIVLTLKYFFTVGSFFDVGDSARDYADNVARILEKEGSDACFAFKVDDLLDAEELGEVN